MPEFFSQHASFKRPAIDSFTIAYLEAAEWLLDESVDRDKIRGWSLDARRTAKEDCEDFQKTNAELLESAYALDSLNYDESRAGHDFYLTRNRHGAGFWDRGLGAIGDELTKSAHGYGENWTDVYRGWITIS